MNDGLFMQSSYSIQLHCSWFSLVQSLTLHNGLQELPWYKWIWKKYWEQGWPKTNAAAKLVKILPSLKKIGKKTFTRQIQQINATKAWNISTLSLIIQTHFRAGISSRLVSPVQLMSSFYNTVDRKDMWILYVYWDGVFQCYTHRPADEEHCDSADQWYVSNQGLEYHTQLPMELQGENVQVGRILSGPFLRTNIKITSSYLVLYLDSFHTSFAKVLFDFYVDLNITNVAASRRAVIRLEIRVQQDEANDMYNDKAVSCVE